MGSLGGRCCLRRKPASPHWKLSEINMKFAFVFPGQGSQSVGMMSAYGDAPVVRQTFEEASSSLKLDLWQMVSEGPSDVLSQTVNTQPLMLAADVAVYRLWVERGGATPAMMAGHSLGEYAALVVAGVIEFRDAIALVRLRAQAMQEAVPDGRGSMAAILGLDESSVRQVCLEVAHSDVVSCANLNDPGQIVIAGHSGAVSRAVELAKARGAKRAVPLSVSAPFHCSLMTPASERLLDHLNGIKLQRPEIPVVNNVDVACYSDVNQIRDALVRQTYSPVRWIETINFFAQQRCDHIIECGPGKVLVKLTRRINHDLFSHSLHDEGAIGDLLAMAGE